MRIKLPVDISNLSIKDEDLVNYTSQSLNAIINVINGEVSFLDNCKTSIVTVTFNASNTEQAFKHSLNKVPLGYIQAGSVLAAQVYNGVTKNTPSLIYLQCNVVTTVTLLVF